ncbi:MAG: cytochrome c biogenesis protein CcsA [Myxococcota bacterium]|jgi:heme exporter protein C|nr:cytochrome c biogenesis protein CcsA [Myxococcota bacterium]
MRRDLAFVALGVALLATGHGMGLFSAPPEATMGESGRILYVHVPTAWIAMLCFLAAFIAAIGSLWTGRLGWDAMVEASAEVGVVLTGLVLVQGSIWGHITWGVWWDWDPRLTTTAVMFVAFAVVLVLRGAIDSPDRRKMASAVATIIAFVDVPIMYMSVRWWRSLHQTQSTPSTVDGSMVLPLRIAAFGMLFLAMGLIGLRWRLARKRLEREQAAPDLPERAPAVRIDAAGGA